MGQGKALPQVSAALPCSVSGEEQLDYKTKIEAGLVIETKISDVGEFARRAVNIIRSIRDGNTLQVIARDMGALFCNESAGGA